MLIKELRQLQEGARSKSAETINRIYGEVMSALGKSAPNLSPTAEKAIKDGIMDAYEEGLDHGYESQD